MQFRCPNCQHPVRLEGPMLLNVEAETLDEVECPSCHSRFSLSSDEQSTAIVTPGLTVAHFEIVHMLGEGSFGTVYKAWDTELHRFVALKIPREGRITSETSKLFLREARAAAGIAHPNVVAVYEMGMHQDTFYIVSELIEGITLSEYLKGRVLEPREAAELLVKLLSGVKVFHDKGIIHRDLKPGNILLDSTNEPHISDFGLARQENSNDVTITQSGRIVGTLLYMPPEQARGENRSLSLRSDIYAMGVILYEVLTGQRPFKSTSSRTLLYSILTEEPVRPRAIRKNVPLDLETICLKAMEKDPARRFGSAAEMAADLTRYLENKPILSRPASRLERLWRFVNRHRLASGLTAVIIPLTILVAYLLMRPAPVKVVRGPSETRIVESKPLTHAVRFRYSLTGSRVPPNALADWTILPLDKRRREPLQNEAIYVQHAATVEEQLPPGEYLVVVNVEGFGFHEVYRFVPEDPTALVQSRYPQGRWEVDEDGTLLMPEVFIRNSADVTNDMILVPAGTYEMGDGIGNRLKHFQTVSGFFVDPHEVSASQFERFASLQDAYSFPKEQYAVCVQWSAAVAYAEYLGKRLLKEAEFEYLARDLGRSAFPGGDEPAIKRDELWGYPEVGKPKADRMNSLPVFGLHSNVAEWTDSLDNAYPGMPDFGLEAERMMNKQANRIVRGGPATLGTNDREQNMWGESTSYREAWNISAVDSEIGFRCARSAMAPYQSP
jgi:serine/threonine protein kinase/formylglycine-generating enzyme required for sulfatase activity